MRRVSLEKIAAWTGGRLRGDGKKTVTEAVIDSRKASPDSLFFCLKGKNTDGHLFAGEARRKGSAVIGETPECDIEVYSSTEALADTASGYRKELKGAVAGVTGSCGKTTTVRMAETAMKGSFPVTASPESYNNHIGLPLALLGAGVEDRAVILEMGANHRGEISRLSEIAAPDAGVITFIGDAHIGCFGSRGDILDAKFELADSLNPGGLLIYNYDQEEVRERVSGYRKLRVTGFGFSPGAELRCAELKQWEGGSSFSLNGENFRINAPGVHNVYNSLGAAALALEYGITPAEISERLESFKLPSHRMQYIRAGGVSIIDDSYNASPSSVRALFGELLKIYPQKDIIAVIGQLNELGRFSEQMHRETGEFLAGLGNVKYILAGGSFAEPLLEAAASRGMPRENLVRFKDPGEASELIKKFSGPGRIAVLKGSRLEKLEDIIGNLK